MTEYVDVLTAGGWLVVDATATEDAGMFEKETEIAGELIAEVRRNIAAGNAMLDETGRRVVIVPGVALAYSYHRKGRD